MIHPTLLSEVNRKSKKAKKVEQTRVLCIDSIANYIYSLFTTKRNPIRFKI